jgi:hypothetical protein
MYITITRESVGPADDLLAPHSKKLRNVQKRSVTNVVEEIRDDYLPREVVGGSTWVIEAESGPVALIAYPAAEIVFVQPQTADSSFLALGKSLKAKCIGTVRPLDWIATLERDSPRGGPSSGKAHRRIV